MLLWNKIAIIIIMAMIKKLINNLIIIMIMIINLLNLLKQL